MTRTRTSVAALMLCAATLLATAAPAGATGRDPFVPPPPPDPLSDTGWQSLEPGPPSPSVRACGTRIVLDEVERLFTLQRRIREYAGGTTWVTFRGRFIVEVRAADGRHARLDNSGPATVIIRDTGVVDVYFQGATVLLPFDPLSATSQRRAGLPRFTSYSGNTHFRDVIDPDTDELLSTEILTRPRFVTDACDLLVR